MEQVVFRPASEEPVSLCEQEISIHTRKLLLPPVLDDKISHHCCAICSPRKFKQTVKYAEKAFSIEKIVSNVVFKPTTMKSSTSQSDPCYTLADNFVDKKYRKQNNPGD